MVLPKLPLRIASSIETSSGDLKSSQNSKSIQNELATPKMIGKRKKTLVRKKNSSLPILPKKANKREINEAPSPVHTKNVKGISY